MATTVTFELNGETQNVTNVSAEDKLWDYIHNAQSTLKGTKQSCGQAGCGACTVLLEWSNPVSGATERRSINSCIRPLLSCQGQKVLTIEGLGSSEQGFSAIQERLAATNGSQCGFCSVGFVTNMTSLLDNNPNPTQLEVEQHFDGNLCRCTGYRAIFTAFKVSFFILWGVLSCFPIRN